MRLLIKIIILLTITCSSTFSYDLGFVYNESNNSYIKDINPYRITINNKYIKVHKNDSLILSENIDNLKFKHSYDLNIYIRDEYNKIRMYMNPEFQIKDKTYNNNYYKSKLASENGLNNKSNKVQEINNKIIYSTLLGGSDNDQLKYINLSNSDGFLFSGLLRSKDFNLINKFYAGSYNSGSDVFIGEFDSDYKPKWITVFGGSGDDGGFNILRTEDNKIAFTGDIRSGDFPVTSDAYQKTYGGGSADGNLTIIDSNGTLYYSTLLGGNAYDANAGLIDDGKYLWSGGKTRSPNFPVTSNAKQSSKNTYYDSFYFKFNIETKQFETISFFGGNFDESFECMTIDSEGNPIYSGWSMSTNLDMGTNPGEFPNSFGDRDGIIIKIDKNTYDVIWGTYIGGSLNDRMYNVTCDNLDNVIVSGVTNSTDYKTRNAFQNNKKAAYDLCIASFSKDGKLNWSSYIGTDGNDGIQGEANYFGGIATNDNNEVAFSGVVRGDNLPTTDLNLYSDKPIGVEDILIGLVTKEGNLISASYFGGNGNNIGYDIEIDENYIYVCGLTTSNDFPVTDDAHQSNLGGGSDGFITILSLSAPITCDYDYFYYPNFSDTTMLNIIKDAEKDGNSLFLTRAEKFKAGAVWYRDPVAVRDGFVTTLSFKFSEGYNDFQFEGSAPGADGIAFVVQNHDPNMVSIHGGGIGYKGLRNSVAVELDLYRNDNPQQGFTDENGNHVAVQSMGADENSTDHSGAANLGINNDIDEIKIDGTVYYMMVDYAVEENVMRVWLSDRPNLSSTKPVVISDKFDLHNLLNLFEHHRAYVGVTSSTGTSYQNHELLSWEFCSYVPSKNWTSVEADREIENKVYPNPAEEKATIELTLDRNNKYYLMDLEGKIYESNRITKNTNGVEINLKGLSNGVYYLRVMNSTINKSKDYKIIKK